MRGGSYFVQMEEVGSPDRAEACPSARRAPTGNPPAQSPGSDVGGHTTGAFKAMPPAGVEQSAARTCET